MIVRSSEQFVCKSALLKAAWSCHTWAVPNRRPKFELIAPSATPEEAAAVVAALERFMRATAPSTLPAGELPNPWTRAALLEGVGREPGGLSAWGDAHPWR